MRISRDFGQKNHPLLFTLCINCVYFSTSGLTNDPMLDKKLPHAQQNPQRRADEVGRRRRSSLSLPQSSSNTDDTLQPVSQNLNSSLSSSGLASSNIGNRPIISEGEVFRIERVSRYDMGHYLCIASNGVFPSVSQRIFLPVACKYTIRNKNSHQHNPFTHTHTHTHTQQTISPSPPSSALLVSYSLSPHRWCRCRCCHPTAASAVTAQAQLFD